MTCPPLKTRNGHISLSALSLLSRALHWTVAMGLPTYVKAINLVVNGMLLMSGLRDWCAALLHTRACLNLQASAASRSRLNALRLRRAVLPQEPHCLYRATPSS